ncbi:MAG: toxin-antitoxin system antitoxin subunit [Persephonella sp.]|nr:MAG: toxin-antitoxin system antitoxin subunit [Persephonella sp.]
MSISRLKTYLYEAKIHIDRLENVLSRLKTIYPLDTLKFRNLSVEELDMLDTLAFRFSKLQDLIGSRIFREYLKEMNYVVEGITFVDILKEIEREGIIDIDTWSEFRKVRNYIAHDYPDELEEKVEAINYLIENTKVLIDVVRKIEGKII